MRAVTIVGIGDDGCAGLSPRAANAVAAADVLAGGERHLAFFPQFRGERIVLSDGIAKAIEAIREAAAERTVVVLASGDPLFYGVADLVARKVGREHVEVIPAPSSVQWAFAKIGLKWDDAAVVSLHGRPRDGFLTRLKRLKKVAVFTDETNTPPAIAAYMRDGGETAWRAWVCESLGGPDERVRAFTLEALAAATDVGPLNVAIFERTDAAWRPPPAVPDLHEDLFAKRVPKKGLITKKEIRTLSIAAMRIRPDAVVWDVGAGSGSVSIEAAMIAFEGRVWAVECDPEGVAICRENCRAFGVDNVVVVEGRAPEALRDLDDPDAVFIGGSKGSMAEIVAVALDRLKPGGRLVANAITLENAAECYRALRDRGLEPEVTLVSIARAEPLARYMRYEALNPVQIFAVTKP